MKKTAVFLGWVIGIISGVLTIFAFFFPSYVPVETKRIISAFIGFIVKNPYGTLITVISLALAFICSVLIFKLSNLIGKPKFLTLCGFYWNKDNQAFCPNCEKPVTVFDDDESYKCNSCGVVMYPGDGIKIISIAEAIAKVKSHNKN